MNTRNEQMREITILVQDFDDFRDKLPQTDAFEMTDCEATIYAPENLATQQLDVMTKFLESAINVLDVVVTTHSQEHIKVIIREKRFSAKNFK